MKFQDKLSIDGLDFVPVSASSSQSLSDAQKNLARNNIDVYSKSEVYQNINSMGSSIYNSIGNSIGNSIYNASKVLGADPDNTEDTKFPIVGVPESTTSSNPVTGKYQLGVYFKNGSLYSKNQEVATQTDINTVTAIAEGKTKAYVTDTTKMSALDSDNDTVTISSFTDLNNTTVALSNFKVGDIIYLTDTKIPDRWISSITTSGDTVTAIVLSKLEISKVPLSDYVLKTRTIAGLNLLNDITVDSLKTAINLSNCKRYTSTILCNKAIRISFNSYFYCIVFIQRPNSNGRLTLIGSGYGVGSARQSWSQLSPASTYKWCIPDNLQGIEIADKSGASAGDSQVIIYSLYDCTVGTTQINDITGTDLSNPLVTTSEKSTWNNKVSANNSTITIQKNGTTVDSFTTNASSAKTININTANDLKVKNNATSSLVSNSFLFRQTANNGAVDNGFARIEKMKGNTVAWNQIIGNDSTTVSVSNSKYGWSGNGFVFKHNDINKTGASYVSVANGILITATHKYYAAASMKMNKDYTKLYDCVFGAMASGGGSNIIELYHDVNVFKKYAVICVPQRTNACIGFFLETTADPDIEFTIKDFVVVDLTLMFGAGNEPTVAQFEAMFPEPYYAYDAGRLLSFNPAGLKTVGFNLWDEEWEVGNIDPSTGANKVDSACKRCVNAIKVSEGSVYHFYFSPITSTVRGSLVLYLYDKNGNYITNEMLDYVPHSVPFNANYTVPSGTSYIRFRFYFSANFDFPEHGCINLSNASKNGTYEAHWENTCHIDITTLKGRATGSTTDVVMFPDGLCSAGSVFDEIDLKNGRAVKRIAKYVFTGAENIVWVNSAGTDAQAYLNDIIPLAKAVNGQNIPSSFYQPRYYYENNWRIVISYISPTVASKEAFKAQLASLYNNGTPLTICYELATPIEYTFDPISDTYPVDALGTEEIVFNSGTAPTSTPAKMDIRYSTNAIDTVKNLPNIYVSAVQEQAFSEEEKELARENIGAAPADSAVYTITAAAGANINNVGTPSVTASTSNNATTLTFNNLKGERGTNIKTISLTYPDDFTSAGSGVYLSTSNYTDDYKNGDLFIDSTGNVLRAACDKGSNTKLNVYYSNLILKGDNGSNGNNGTDGNFIWEATTSISHVSNNVGNTYSISTENLIGPSGKTPKVGDIVFYKSDKYTVYSYNTVLDGSSYLTLSEPVSLKGNNGTNGTNGERGSIIWRTLSTPSLVGGNDYRISENSLSNQIKTGDWVIAEDGYIYLISGTSSGYIYLNNRFFIKGDSGTNGTNGSIGATGERGNSILKATAAISLVSGSNYRTTDSNVLSNGKIGDFVIKGSDLYYLYDKDTTYSYLNSKVSLKGANGGLGYIKGVAKGGPFNTSSSEESEFLQHAGPFSPGDIYLVNYYVPVKTYNGSSWDSTLPLNGEMYLNSSTNEVFEWVTNSVAWLNLGRIFGTTPNISITTSVTNDSSGVPSVAVNKSGSTSNPTFALTFKNFVPSTINDLYNNVYTKLQVNNLLSGNLSPSSVDVCSSDSDDETLIEYGNIELWGDEGSYMNIVPSGIHLTNGSNTKVLNSDGGTTDLSNYRTVADSFTKTEINNTFRTKSDSYNKSEIDGKVSTINTAITTSENNSKTYTNNQLNTRLDNLSLKCLTESLYNNITPDSNTLYIILP